MTPLEQYDTAIDLLVKARNTINDSTVQRPRELTAVDATIADRLRQLATSQINVCEILLHDYFEKLGLFEEPGTPSNEDSAS